MNGLTVALLLFGVPILASVLIGVALGDFDLGHRPRWWRKWRGGTWYHNETDWWFGTVKWEREPRGTTLTLENWEPAVSHPMKNLASVCPNCGGFNKRCAACVKRALRKHPDILPLHGNARIFGQTVHLDKVDQ